VNKEDFLKKISTEEDMEVLEKHSNVPSLLSE